MVKKKSVKKKTPKKKVKKVSRKKPFKGKKKSVKNKFAKRKTARKKRIIRKTAVNTTPIKQNPLRTSVTNLITKTKRILKKMPRAGTGLPSFDKMVQGGFERNSINLIAGGSGSGKSIFALQYLMEGVKKGETVLYITFEEKKEEFYENMGKFGWNLQKLENSGKFIFLEYSPEKVKMMLDEGGGTVESIVLKNKIKRLVIDSITSFSLLFDDELSRRQSNLGLFDIIRKWDCTTLLTVQYDPLDKEDTGISSIQFEVDSITLLYYISIKNKRERFIEVLKMRGTNHSKELRSFEIKKGIKIGKRARKKAITK